MTSPSHSLHPLRRLFRYAHTHRAQVIRATIFSLLNKLFDLAPPALIGVAVDLVVERDDSLLARLGFASPTSQLTALGVATLVIWVLESLFEYLHAVAWRNLAQIVQHELRRDAFAHVGTLELRYFEDRSTGRLLSILSDDVNQLERFLDGGANSIIQISTTVVLVSATFFVAAPDVAWLAMMPVPFVIWGSIAFQKRIAPRYEDVRERVGVLNTQLTNAISGIATVKSFSAQDHETDRLEEVSRAYLESNRRAIRLSSAFSPLIRMIIVVGFLLILIYGGRLALNDELAVGIYSMLVFLTQRLLWPLTGLGTTLDLYQRAMASTKRILDLLDTAPTIVDGPDALDVGSVAGAVRFDDVSFAYRPGEPVLTHCTLDFPAGRTSAVVGSTGSGKTTIIKLLLRFYDAAADGTPRQGAITIDGKEIRELRLDDLRSAIAVVSQDVFLFDGTVHENIAYGRAHESDHHALRVDRADVEAAAEAAEAGAFIRALPQGFDTLIGERGQKLSGGQRQRLSMARAILKDAPILILDEATSAVDNETEAAIQRSLERVSIGRTTIVIAHRLSTIRGADRIFVLDSGQVAETGRHNELVAGGGLYARLWSVQTGEGGR